MTRKIRRFVIATSLIMPSVLLGFSVVQTHQLQWGFDTALNQNQRLLMQNETLIELLSISTREALAEITELQAAHGLYKCSK